MEFLQANWFWILLGAGAVWFLFRRGGMGCGMGGHSSHDSRTSRSMGDTPPARESHDGHRSEKSPARPNEESPAREVETAPARRHRGC